jgi:hypothetical protein
VNVWTRVVDRGSFLTATLRIIVKRKGIFFNRQLVSGFYTCMLSRQGHLVIYTQHSSNEGYAVNLRRANKIVFKMLNNKEAPSSNSNKHPFQQVGFIYVTKKTMINLTFAYFSFSISSKPKSRRNGRLAL